MVHCVNKPLLENIEHQIHVLSIFKINFSQRIKLLYLVCKQDNRIIYIL